MKYQRFDELPAWQEAARLYQRILDLFDEPNIPVSPTFRGNLERAALAVSNGIAESRDRKTWTEAAPCLVSARAAAVDVQSMMAVISQRPKLARHSEPLQQIRSLAESCNRQLAAWMGAIESGSARNKESSNSSGQASGAPNVSAGADSRREN